jgi:hypothetical protein
MARQKVRHKAPNERGPQKQLFATPKRELTFPAAAAVIAAACCAVLSISAARFLCSQVPPSITPPVASASSIVSR